MLESTRTPPCAPDAEAACLGALLAENEGLPRVRAMLPSPEAFYDARNRSVYEAVLSLADGGRPFDLVTVAAWLSDRKSPCGPAYPSALVTSVGIARNAEFYAAVVREAAIKREVIGRLTRLVGQAYDPTTDAFDLLDDARAAVGEMGRALPGHALTPSALAVPDAANALLHESERGLPPGAPTGFVSLDAILGPLRPGSLYCIAGRPAMGKSALGLSIAHRTAQRGNAVALFSLEMSTAENVERLLAAEADVSGNAIARRRLMPDERERIADARERLSSLPIHYDDTPAITPEDVRAKLHRVTADGPVPVVVVDYLQLMRGRGDNRTQEVGYVSRNLKAIAKEYACAVIALAQLSRGVEGRADKRPMLSDLRDSGEIEQDCDVVAFLYRPEYYGESHVERGEEFFNAAGLCEVIIAKNRRGETGTCWLRFDGSRTRFLDRHAEAESARPLVASGDGAASAPPVYHNSPF